MQRPPIGFQLALFLLFTAASVLLGWMSAHAAMRQCNGNDAYCEILAHLRLAAGVAAAVAIFFGGFLWLSREVRRKESE